MESNENVYMATSDHSCRCINWQSLVYKYLALSMFNSFHVGMNGFYRAACNADAV